MTMTDFIIQMNNYYFDKLLAYQKVLENTNKRNPLCLVIAYAIKDYLSKNFEIGMFENFGVVDMNLVHFDYNSKFNDKIYNVYMNRDFHITQIRITNRVEQKEVSYIGDFRLENTGKLYVPNDCKIKVDLEYTLDIGRKTIGAKILDESEEFKMFKYELYPNPLLEENKYALYHYLTEDLDLNQNIGIMIIVSVFSYLFQNNG